VEKLLFWVEILGKYCRLLEKDQEVILYERNNKFFQIMETLQSVEVDKTHETEK
jgi:hypothetical protein